MIKVNIFEAKAKLSEYVDRAAHGERVIVCRHNHPVAELRAVAGARREPRPIGPLPGRPAFDVASTFFEPLSDEEHDSWLASPVMNVPASTVPDARVAEQPSRYRTKRASARRSGPGRKA